jgi:hypothetical protein
MKQGQATRWSSCSGQNFPAKLLWSHRQPQYQSDYQAKLSTDSCMNWLENRLRNTVNEHCGSIVNFCSSTKTRNMPPSLRRQAASIPNKPSSTTRYHLHLPPKQSFACTDSPLNRSHCTLGSSFLLHTRTSVRNLEAIRATAPLVCPKQVFRPHVACLLDHCYSNQARSCALTSFKTTGARA